MKQTVGENVRTDRIGFVNETFEITRIISRKLPKSLEGFGCITDSSYLTSVNVLNVNLEVE